MSALGYPFSLFGYDMAYTLLSMLVFATTILMLLSCDRKEPETPAAKDYENFRFTNLKTVEDVRLALNEATSHTNVIFLIHVSGAPMSQQQNLFAEFKRDYKIRYPKSDLAFRYIDCGPISEDYEPLRSLPGWKEFEEKNNGARLVHGYGELAWCKNGRILHVERPLNFGSADALIEKTESLGIGRIAK